MAGFILGNKNKKKNKSTAPAPSSSSGLGSASGSAAGALAMVRRMKTWQKIVAALACVVVFITTYMLILPAITLERSGPYCGVEAHQHVSACYDESGNLICGLSEHTHTLACYADTGADLEDSGIWEATFKNVELTGNYAADILQIARTQLGYTESTKNYIVSGSADSNGAPASAEAENDGEISAASLNESEDAESYASLEADADSSRILDTTAAEPDTAAAEPDTAAAEPDTAAAEPNTAAAEPNTAATEPAEVTEARTESQTETQAESQTETSTENPVPEDDLSGTKKGYTRYGAWYGIPYGDWCAMFVSFCLNYAEVPTSAFPENCNCQNWINTLKSDEYNLYHPASDIDYRSTDDYVPAAGDIIFFDWDADGLAEHVGIVAGYSDTYVSGSAAENVLDESIDEALDALEQVAADAKPVEAPDTGAYIVTIEGNSSDKVQMQCYAAQSSVILGYGELPDSSAASTSSVTETEDTADAEPVEAPEPETVALEEPETATSAISAVNETDIATVDDFSGGDGYYTHTDSSGNTYYTRDLTHANSFSFDIYVKNEDGTWSKVDSDSSLNVFKDSYRISFEFSMLQDNMANAKVTIDGTEYYALEYAAPEELDLSAFAGVKNEFTMTGDDGQNVSAYWTVEQAEDGSWHVLIYVNSSEAGDSWTKMNGNFSVEFEIDQDKVDWNDDNPSIEFPGTSSPGTSYPVDKDITGLLEADKSSTYNEADKTITYTVTVKAEGGDAYNLGFSDTMSKYLDASTLSIDSITVDGTQYSVTKASDGSYSVTIDGTAYTLSVTQTPSDDGTTSLSITLKDSSGGGYTLKEGSTFVLTYTVALDTDATKSETNVVSNEIEVSASPSIDTEPEPGDTDTEDRTVKISWVTKDKSGDVTKENESYKLSWSIVINPDGFDLSGKTFTDTIDLSSLKLSGADLNTIKSSIESQLSSVFGNTSATVTVNADSQNGKITITVAFPEESSAQEDITAKYEFSISVEIPATYVDGTSAESYWVNNQIVDEENHGDTGGNDYSIDNQKIIKTQDTSGFETNSTEGKISYSVTLKGGASANDTFTDSLSWSNTSVDDEGNQTTDTNVYGSIDTSTFKVKVGSTEYTLSEDNGTYSLKDSSENVLGTVTFTTDDSDPANNTGFTITFSAAVDENTDIVITYDVICDSTDITGSRTYKNTANWKNQSKEVEYTKEKTSVTWYPGAYKSFKAEKDDNKDTTFDFKIVETDESWSEKEGGTSGSLTLHSAYGWYTGSSYRTQGSFSGITYYEEGTWYYVLSEEIPVYTFTIGEGDNAKAYYLWESAAGYSLKDSSGTSVALSGPTTDWSGTKYTFTVDGSIYTLTIGTSYDWSTGNEVTSTTYKVTGSNSNELSGEKTNTYNGVTYDDTTYYFKVVVEENAAKNLVAHVYYTTTPDDDDSWKEWSGATDAAFENADENSSKETSGDNLAKTAVVNYDESGKPESITWYILTGNMESVLGTEQIGKSVTLKDSFSKGLTVESVVIGFVYNNSGTNTLDNTLTLILNGQGYSNSVTVDGVSKGSEFSGNVPTGEGWSHYPYFFYSGSLSDANQLELTLDRQENTTSDPTSTNNEYNWVLVTVTTSLDYDALTWVTDPNAYFEVSTVENTVSAKINGVEQSASTEVELQVPILAKEGETKSEITTKNSSDWLVVSYTIEVNPGAEKLLELVSPADGETIDSYLTLEDDYAFNADLLVQSLKVVNSLTGEELTYTKYLDEVDESHYSYQTVYDSENETKTLYLYVPDGTALTVTYEMQYEASIDTGTTDADGNKVYTFGDVNSVSLKYYSTSASAGSEDGYTEKTPEAGGSFTTYYLYIYKYESGAYDTFLNGAVLSFWKYCESENDYELNVEYKYREWSEAGFYHTIDRTVGEYIDGLVRFGAKADLQTNRLYYWYESSAPDGYVLDEKSTSRHYFAFYAADSTYTTEDAFIAHLVEILKAQKTAGDEDLEDVEITTDWVKENVTIFDITEDTENIFYWTETNENGDTVTGVANDSGAAWTPNAAKTLVGGTLITGDFTFTLRAADENFNALEGENAWHEEAMALRDGTITFSTQKFSEEGTYYYTLSENAEIPQGAVQNSDGTYTYTSGGITYTYSYDDSGALVVEWEEDGLHCRQTYDPMVYHITVKVTKDANGELSVETEIVAASSEGSADSSEAVRDASFTNTITKGVSWTPEANKTLNGETSSLTGGDFTFTITQVDENLEELKDADGNLIYSETVTNTADGKIDFSAIEYSEPGVYYYKITEVLGTEAGITYDTSTYYVRVTVTETGASDSAAETTVASPGRGGVAEGDGGVSSLAAEGSEDDETSEATGLSISVEYFKASDSSDDGSGGDDGEGNGDSSTGVTVYFDYNLYYNYVSEAFTSINVPKDTNVTITVNPSGTGDSVPNYTVYGGDGSPTLETGSWDTSRTQLSYTVDSTATYSEYCVNFYMQNSHYSDAGVDTAVITVSYTDSDGNEVVKVCSYNGGSWTWGNGSSGEGGDTGAPEGTERADTVTFNNTSENEPVSWEPKANKTLNGGTLKNEQFSFTITEMELNGSTLTEKQGGYSGTAANDADGNISWDKISYYVAGTYYYKISEVIPEGAASVPEPAEGTGGTGTYTKDGVTYDGKAYYVKVVVEADSDGKLTASVTYYSDESLTQQVSDTSGVTFTNKIENGVVLPETGGSGTWWIYALGILFILGSALPLLLRGGARARGDPKVRGKPPDG